MRTLIARNSLLDSALNARGRETFVLIAEFGEYDMEII